MQVQQLGLAEGQLYTICKWLDQFWRKTWPKVLQGHNHHLVVTCPYTPQRGAAPLLLLHIFTLENCAEHTTEFIASQDYKAIRLSSLRIGWAACKASVGVYFPMMALFTSRKLVVTTSWKDSIQPCSSVWTLQSEPDKRVWQIGRVPRLCRDTCKYRIPNRSLMTATHFSRLFSNWVSEIYQLFSLFRRVKRGIADELWWFADKRNPKIWNFETESITSRGCWRWAWLSYFHSDHTEFHIPSIISFLLDLFGTMLARWMASTLRTMYISYALEYIKISKHKTVHVFFAQNHG